MTQPVQLVAFADDAIEDVTDHALDAPDSATAIPVARSSGVKVVDRRASAASEERDRRASEERDAARAFRALYDEHVAFVWRNLRRLGVAHADVEDKVQEVFVVAHRRFAEFEERGHGPRAWLFQILLRVASDARRHRRRHPVDPDGGVAQERQSIEAPQAAHLARKQALDLLDQALGTIEVGRRAVLVLHEIEQMTAPDIARTLEIPLNTVYSRLRVARIELDQEIARLREGAAPAQRLA